MEKQATTDDMALSEVVLKLKPPLVTMLSVMR